MILFGGGGECMAGGGMCGEIDQVLYCMNTKLNTSSSIGS